MKGFIKILEAILASVVLLTSLTFFFQLSVKPTEWDDALLQIRAEDVVYSLVKNGTVDAAVENNNANIINDEMKSLIPPTLDYSFEIRGIPNPIIFVGCVCGDAEIDNLEDRLAPLTFNYKDRRIEIRIDNDTFENPREETNILFKFGYQNLSRYRSSLNEFLERGGTIFMVASLSENEINDGYMNETFGLRPGGIPNPPTSSFYNPDNENLTPFRIAKYYRNLTTASGSFVFGSSSAVAVDAKTIVGSTNSFVKINKEVVNGNGRTVWYSLLPPSPTASDNNLLKATIMWASGESFKLDVLPKTPAEKNIQSRLIASGTDVYEAVITVWRIFG